MSSKLVRGAGQPVRPLRGDAHNIGSAVLLLKEGKLQVILESDVEVGVRVVDGICSLGLISNKDCPDLYANLVKIAH
jgi:hypothetical protein